MGSITIRPATRSDAGLILDFIIELARYEKAEEQVEASVKDIENSLFADDSNASALICSLDDQPIGYAIYFYNYSTWLGQKGLYLEDLYISPQQRGVGAGKVLLSHLAKVACDQNCGRFEWSVLDWNEPAIQFYESLGAKAQSEWVGYRLTGEALKQLANNAG